MHLLCLLTLFQIIATGFSVSHTCYYCQNHNPESHWYYDENCGAADYDGHTDVCHHGCDSCYVHTYHGEGDEYKVERGSASGHMDGDCSDSSHKTSCYCVGDLCNNYLCSDPGACTTTAPPSPSTTIPSATPEPITTTDTITTEPTEPTTQPITTKPTDTTTIPTGPTTQPITTVPTDPTTQPITTLPTDPTTQPITTVPTEPTSQPITTVPTDPPTDPTTVTTQTTTSPTTTPPSIECFDCQMTEPNWDNYDPNCNAPNYQGNTYKCVNCHSCYTQVLEDGSVVRGEAGAFQDGQCLYGTNEELGLDYVDCYCTSELCNTSLCEDC